MPQFTPDEIEEWRPVVGYEGLYEVSSIGRVRSLPRRRQTGAGIRTLRERLLTPKPGLYPTVSLSRLGDPRTLTIHSLVLIAFVGPAPPGMEACHNDGNKWNSKLSNLRWDTRSGNTNDRVSHGVSNRGERCGSAKLTSRQVDEIRQRFAQGERQSALAREYGVSQSNISQIVNRKRWSYVEGS